MGKILKRYGLEILPLASVSGTPVVDLEAVVGSMGIEELAEIEHARWNVERLMLGWKYGPVRDNAALLHPLILPWSKVKPDAEKEKDRAPFRKLPEILSHAGLGIFKIVK
jgi:hypothetical protein